MSRIANIDYYANWKQESFPVNTDARKHLEQALDGATSLMLTRVTPRDFFSGSTIEVFDGLGHNSSMPWTHTEYITHQAPILGTPTLEYRESDTWIAVTNNWECDATNGIIAFYNDYYFEHGLRNYRLTYNYDSCIDNGDRRTCCVIAAAILREAKRDGKTSETIAGVISTFSSRIPKEILAELDRRKR